MKAIDEEKMAAAMHWAWSEWTKYMLDSCSIGPAGSLCIPRHLVARWRRQIATDYNGLSESEKRSDRSIARGVIKFVDGD